MYKLMFVFVCFSKCRVRIFRYKGGGKLFRSRNSIMVLRDFVKSDF